jgi:4-hydroxy-tetrahydrodipicolinate synthase
MVVLSKFDEGPDLVLYYKHLMVLEGNEEYRYQINPADRLSAAQQAWLESQWRRFRGWWERWPGSQS